MYISMDLNMLKQSTVVLYADYDSGTQPTFSHAAGRVLGDLLHVIVVVLHLAGD